jgi:hypothetical protein
MKETSSPLAAFGRLIEIQERLQGESLFPLFDGGLGSFNVLLAATRRDLAERFAAAVAASFGPLLEAVRIRFLRPLELFEDLPDGGLDVHSLWILFPPDRFELRGQVFQEWADRHRRALAQPSVFAFRVFQAGLLEKVPEPIERDEPEPVAGRLVPVVSCPLDAEARSFGTGDRARPALEFLEGFLLEVLASRHGPWVDLAGRWDDAVAAMLDRRMAGFRREAPRSGSPAADAFLQVRELFRLRAAAGEASREIEHAYALAGELDRLATVRGPLDDRIGQLARALNDVRLDPRGRWRTGRNVAFTQEFQRLRTRLLTLAQKLRDEFKQRNEPEQARQFEAAAREIHQDVTIILLGPFSSGKSTFLNTLLGLTPDRHPLPTSGKPETATINVLEFARKEEVVPFFAEVVELTLFSSRELEEDAAAASGEPVSRSANRRWLINKVEIAALLRWIRQGLLDLGSAAVTRFPLDAGGGRETASRPLSPRDVEHLERLVQGAESHCDERELDRLHAPLVVSNLRFRRRPAVPSGLAQAQEKIKQPEVALQLDHALFRRTIEILRGLRFVDTPGTDSAITYHHFLARKFIERHRGAPIVYCFDGDRAGGNEDRKNVRFLVSLAGEIDRVFFVITKRGSITTPAEVPEVRAKVEDLLTELRLPGKRVYFIDALEAREKPDEAEWKGLITALKEFVDRNRTDLLRSQGDGLLRQPLEGLRAAALELLEGLRSEIRRGEKVRETSARLEALARIAEDFPLHVERARERVFQAKDGDLLSELDRILRSLQAFDCGAYKTFTLNSKVAQIKGVLKPLDAWPDRLRSNLDKASRDLHGRLREALAKGFPQDAARLAVRELPPELNPLELADVRKEAGQEIAYRFFTSYRGDLQRKVDRLVELLQKKRRSVEKLVLAKFDETAGHYAGVLRSLDERLRKALQDLQRADERERKKAIAAHEQRLAFLDRCLKEYRAI